MGAESLENPGVKDSTGGGLELLLETLSLLTFFSFICPVAQPRAVETCGP